MWNETLVRTLPVGKLFVISAPAGAGKTTLANRLVSTFPNVAMAATLTTRAARAGEVPGKDYEFVSKEEFLARQEKGDLLEHIELHENFYGTSSRNVSDLRYAGKHVLLVIDTRGALAIQQLLNPVLIFIKPPSMDVLKERLEGRNSEDESTRQRRLEWAKKELLDEQYFDYSIVNDNIDNAFSVLASIVIAESHRLQEEPHG
jgi:guanylate kinase